MECTNFNEMIGPCSMPDREIKMEQAGKMVNLDLIKPIDVSQMQIVGVSVNPFQEEYSCRGEFGFIRETELRALVINEHGEREELEITFKLKSKRMPDIRL